MTNYYIFKTDLETGKPTHICNGSHKDERECRIHFQSYMYGFMDACSATLGHGNFGLTKGNHDQSFIFTFNGKIIEYFMLLDKEGQDLILTTA